MNFLFDSKNFGSSLLALSYSIHYIIFQIKLLPELLRWAHSFKKNSFDISLLSIFSFFCPNFFLLFYKLKELRVIQSSNGELHINNRIINVLLIEYTNIKCGSCYNRNYPFFIEICNTKSAKVFVYNIVQISLIYN